jgi:hypothetical protein
MTSFGLKAARLIRSRAARLKQKRKVNLSFFAQNGEVRT